MTDRESPRWTCAHGQRIAGSPARVSSPVESTPRGLRKPLRRIVEATSDAVEKRALESGAALHHVNDVPRCGLSSTADVQTGRHGVASAAAPTTIWPGLFIFRARYCCVCN